MSNAFNDSVSIFINLEEDDVNKGTRHVGQGEGGVNTEFTNLVNNVLEDMKKMGKVHASIHDINEQIKVANDALTMENLRARLNFDLHSLLTLAKQINKKFDGLVAANAAQRRQAGSSDDNIGAAKIADLIENLKHMMRDFQGLRIQMETDHRQLIENRYYAITKEKATNESIDNLIESGVGPGGGGAAVVDAVAEIKVRRDTMREVRTNLMNLHQIFLGLTTPVVEGQGGAGGFSRTGCTAPSPLDVNPPAAMGKVTGTGGLNDYEKEMQKQAYIAMGIALVVLFTIIGLLLNIENKLENGN